MNTIVRIQFGSHLYGTNTPTSDLDYKAVHVPSADEILLQRVRGSVCNKREKSGDGVKNEAGEMDEESYSLQRYLSLLTEGQTVAIDMLFAPHPLDTSNLWQYIRENRHRLLTKRSAAFVGYCRTQANKYGIKGSRVAAAREASDFFATALAKHGPTAKVSEVGGELTNLLGEHTQLLELPMNASGSVMGWFLECCNRKVAFTNTIKAAYEIYTRIHESYGKRAKLAESNEGIDWKALSHAVRVGQEAIELLATGEITFPLRNAEHILEIKRGLLPYDTVAAEIEGLLGDMESASEKSSLREDADYEFIDDLVKHTYRNAIEAQP